MEKKKNFLNNFLWDNKAINMISKSEVSHLDVLKNNPVFEDFSRRELKFISQMAYEREYKADEYAFENGQPGAAMFIIISGEVQIVRESNDGTKVELIRLRDGETFGELALLDDSPRSASAIATKPTKALAFFREDLTGLIHSNPEIGAKIVRKLAIITGVRLRLTNDALIQREEEINKLRAGNE